MRLQKIIIFVLLLLITFSLPASAKEYDINEMFEEAEIAYSWFSRYCIHTTIGKLDFENPPLSYNGARYYKIKEGITKMDDLEKHLLSLFSPEIAQNLLISEFDGHKYFIEIEGILYYTLDAVALNDYTIGERKLSIISESSDSIRLELEYKVIDDDGKLHKTEYIDYSLEKNASDTFVFTSFTLPATKWNLYEKIPNTGDISYVMALIMLLPLAAVIIKKSCFKFSI